MNDVSDGVGNEALEIAEASQVDIIIHESQLPCHEEVRRAAGMTGLDPLELVLFGGEDYELLFTARPDASMHELARRIENKTSVPIHLIGEVRKGTGKVFLKRNGGELEPLSPGGFQHFS